MAAVAWNDCLMYTSNDFTISLELVLTYVQLEKDICYDVFGPIVCLYSSMNRLKLKTICISRFDHVTEELL